jgi:hypothetical protein
MERPCGASAEQHRQEKAWRMPIALRKRLAFIVKKKGAPSFRKD